MSKPLWHKSVHGSEAWLPDQPWPQGGCTDGWTATSSSATTLLQVVRQLHWSGQVWQRDGAHRHEDPEW